MGEEAARPTGVFTGYYVCLAQVLESAKGYIFEISYRGRDDYEGQRRFLGAEYVLAGLIASEGSGANHVGYNA